MIPFPEMLFQKGKNETTTVTSKTAAACSTDIFLCLVLEPFPREFTEKARVIVS